jgi:hypothetical protein
MQKENRHTKEIGGRHAVQLSGLSSLLPAGGSIGKKATQKNGELEIGIRGVLWLVWDGLVLDGISRFRGYFFTPSHQMQFAGYFSLIYFQGMWL